MIRPVRVFLIVQVNCINVKSFDINHLDFADSQNFSEEMNLVGEDAGRKELDSSITETKLDDGETLCDNLGLSDVILNTDKKVSVALQLPSNL